jgi:copper homeostasis protein CutC
MTALSTLTDAELFSRFHAAIDACEDNHRRLTLFAVEAHTERVLTNVAVEQVAKALIDGAVARGAVQR